jgi:hypothetical protein
MKGAQVDFSPLFFNPFLRSYSNLLNLLVSDERWNAERGTRNVECGMRGARCGMRECLLQKQREIANKTPDPRTQKAEAELLWNFLTCSNFNYS